MRILLIEDDATLAATMTAILVDEGWLVEYAAGPEAFEMAVRTRPDVIVLDLLMPGIDGWAVREQLWREPATSQIPVVICSALRAQDRRDARLMAAAVLDKPFDLQQLVDTLRAVGGGSDGD